MTQSSVFEKLSEFREKFAGLLQCRKKSKSLDNYSEVAFMDEEDLLFLNSIKRALKRGFLKQYQIDFLNGALEEYQLNYLFWSHKTKWLKSEMREMAKNSRKQHNQMIFNYDKEREMPDIPLEALFERSMHAERRV